MRNAPANLCGASSCTAASRTISIKASCAPLTGWVTRRNSCPVRASRSFKSIMKESPSWLVVPMISWRAPAWAAAAAAHEIFASHPGSRFSASTMREVRSCTGRAFGFSYFALASGAGALHAQFAAFFKSPVPLYSAYCG